MTHPAHSVRTRPSPIRWRILALLMALCFISHFNRASMASAGDERIMKQFGISTEQMGVVFSAFLVGYTVFMIPGGFFLGRFGPRVALAGMGLGTALFCAFTGMVGWGFIAANQVWLSLLIVRSLMGLLTTPLHPASARAAANWFPEQQRALANGLITGAALLAYAAVHPLFGALIDRFDWPVAFLISGAGTAGLALTWYFSSSDRPATPCEPGAPAPAASAPHSERGIHSAALRPHLPVDPAERTEVRAPYAAANPHRIRSAVAATPGFGALLRDRSLLMLTLSYAAVGY